MEKIILSDITNNKKPLHIFITSLFFTTLINKWNRKRKEIAEKYNKELKNIKTLKEIYYHLYVIKTKNRDRLKEYLNNNNIKTEMHYPIPAHLQKCFPEFHHLKGTLPVTEQHAKEILSLPMYPELTEEETEAIISSINNFK